MEFIRIDYLFSYWIILWFIIYFIGTRIYPTINIPNPKFALYLGLIENILSLFYIIWLKSPISIVIKYVIMILLIKAIPIYLIKEPIRIWKDVYNSFLVFLFYMIYLTIHKESLYGVYDRTLRSVKNGENNTMMFYLFDKLGF